MDFNDGSDDTGHIIMIMMTIIIQPVQRRKVVTSDWYWQRVPNVEQRKTRFAVVLVKVCIGLELQTSVHAVASALIRRL